MRLREPSSLAEDDQSLARLARGGDSSALEALVQRWQVPLVCFLERRVGNRSDAEDLFQETFVRVHQGLINYDDRRAFRTWIFTIAWRLAANHLRDRKRADGDEVLAGVADNASPPLETAAQGELREGLWAIARRVLNPDSYAILWMYYVQELPPREIAQVTGRSWVGIKTVLHRARKALEPHVRTLHNEGAR